MAGLPSAALTLLEQWLQDRLSPDALSWYQGRLEKLAEDRDFYLAIALAPRKLGKADLAPTHEERSKAEQICPGWTPSRWTVDQTARIAFLLSSPEERFRPRLDQLCSTGDMGEQITLYQALPLYPNPESLVSRATEGLRTNVVPVFEAVAHANPFPKDQFSEAEWNQMVLKALFVGSRLHPILGLDKRANEALANTLIDYAHERWAAHREVSPELWRCVGPFLEDTSLPDIQKVWIGGDTLSKQAAGLALASSKLPAAKALLDTDPTLSQAIDREEVSWGRIYQALTSS